jgi:DamX protein
MSSPLLRRAFKPASWLVHIELIRRLVTKHSTIIVLMAERAGGKSSFIDLMRLKMDASVLTMLLSLHDRAAAQQALQHLAQWFNIDDPNLSFSNFFTYVAPATQSTLIVIDDAHHLTPRELHDLMTGYQSVGLSKNIHLMFATDPKMHAFFEDLSTGELNDCIHMLEPGDLNESEARTYMTRYVQGKECDSSWLSAQEFTKFYDQTRGNLVKMNDYLSQLAPKSQEHQITRTSSRWMLVSLLLVAALGVASFLQKQMNSDFEIANAEPAQESNVTEMTEPAPLKLSVIPPFFVGATQQTSLPPPHQEAFQEETDLETVKLNHEFSEVDKVVMGPDLEDTASNPHENMRSSTSVVISAVPSSGFTLQIYAAKNIEEIQAFMARYQLAYPSVNIYQVLKAQVRWYVLTTGGFDDSMQAHTALDQLPDELKQLHPWVRPFQELKSIG